MGRAHRAPPGSGRSQKTQCRTPCWSSAETVTPPGSTRALSRTNTRAAVRAKIRARSRSGAVIGRWITQRSLIGSGAVRGAARAAPTLPAFSSEVARRVGSPTDSFGCARGCPSSDGIDVQGRSPPVAFGGDRPPAAVRGVRQQGRAGGARRVGSRRVGSRRRCETSTRGANRPQQHRITESDATDTESPMSRTSPSHLPTYVTRTTYVACVEAADQYWASQPTARDSTCLSRPQWTSCSTIS
ncbi:hypothetical protein GAR06_04388 [Micromonospora saelicesensis]|nr:hypothetical protein GAR06_04388 [Micromonospora saelicesensis]